MEPIALATVTAAVTTLAMECAKNTASETGKEFLGQGQEVIRLGQGSDDTGARAASCHAVNK